MTVARARSLPMPFAADRPAAALPDADPVVPPPPQAVAEVRAALVVDDDPGMLGEAIDALAVFPDAEVRCAGSLAEAERLVRRRHFDLALVDLGLPDGSGITLIRRLASPAPGIGDGPTLCVARTMFEDDAHLFPALAAGAQGYVLKGDAPERLREQLLAAARGEPPISPAVARRVLGFFRAHPSHVVPAGVAAGPLSPREAEVLRLVARGHTVAEAAEVLGVSENTVKAHVKRTYAKLDVRTRVGAAREARRLGILREDDHGT